MVPGGLFLPRITQMQKRNMTKLQTLLEVQDSAWLDRYSSLKFHSVNFIPHSKFHSTLFSGKHCICIMGILFIQKL